MATEIKVPAIGESITEGTISRWLKKDGEAVRAEEPVFELETEKATTEVPAPAAGTLHIAVPEGKTVPIGAVVGRIDETHAVSPKHDGAPKAPKEPARPPKDKAKPAPVAARETESPAKEKLLSPAAPRLLEEKAVD